MNKILLYLFFLFIAIIGKSYADTVSSITISGNKRIQSETIIEYGKIIKNKSYTANDLDEIQKKIFQTGFFKNISISLSNNNLLINVIENPIVDFFSINIIDDKNSDEVNKIYDSIKLGSNKIFTDYLLKNDLDYIKDFYNKKGYSSVEVVPRISELENNKINILINIKKNKIANIRRIFFIGDKKFSSSDLIDVITSTEYGWWKFLSSSSFINIDRIDLDSNLLKKYYLNNGYYDAQILSINIKKFNDSSSDIIFSIASGNLYKFGNLKISNNKNLINENILKYINLLQKKYLSDLYSSSNKNLFLQKINEFIAKEKIEFVKLEINEVKNKDKIDLNIDITQTKKKYVNKINIIGNSITEESFIRSNIIFSEGDSYNNYKVNKSLDNLKNTGVFKDVTTTEINQDLDNELVNIDIKITEQPTGSISAGAGYGSNGGSVGFGLNELNFLGKGISLGGNLNIGSQKIEGYINLAVPDFFDSNRKLYTNLYSTKTQYSNTLYESTKTGFDLSTGYELFEDIYFKPGLGMNYDSISVNSGASAYLFSQNGNYITQQLHYNIERDLRDKKFNSRDGTLLGFTQQFATLYSDIPYIKNHIYGSTYFPITEKQTANLKYGYSNIESLNSKNIKLSDRLFLPNQYSKGFEPRGFGPKDSSSGDFIGGNQYIYGSATTTLPNLSPESWNLKSVFFVNAFNLWRTDNNNSIDSNSLRSSLGIGLDWKSPMGPINISIAKPISSEPGDKTKTFSFEIGTIF